MRRLECIQQVSAAYSSQSARSAATGSHFGNEDYIIELKLAAVVWFEEDERICKMCNDGEVENVKDFLLHCNGVAEERKEMVRLMIEIMEGWQEMEGKDKVVCVVDKACENGRVRKEVEMLYKNVWIELEARP